MNKKKILSLVAIFLIILVFLGFLFLRRKPAPPEPKLPTQSFIPTPYLPDHTKGELRIEAVFDKKDFSFPESTFAVLSKPLPPLSESEVLEIANKMGFGKNYITSNDIRRGKTYIWRGGGKALTVYSKINRVVYNSEVSFPTSNKQLTNKALIKIAEDFLTGSSLVEEGALNFSFFTFIDINLEEIRPVPKKEATAYRVNFSPVESDIKLVEFDPFKSPISVWIAPDGTVFKAEVASLGQTTFSSEQFALKNYEEFISSISDAVIMSLDDGNLFMGDLPRGSVRKVTINKVELAYLVDSPNSKIYQPIFFLQGIATISGLAEPVNAVLYLPAIKKP